MLFKAVFLKQNCEAIQGAPAARGAAERGARSTWRHGACSTGRRGALYSCIRRCPAGRGGVLVPQVARSAVSALRGWSGEPQKSVEIRWNGIEVVRGCGHRHVPAKCARGYPRKHPGSTPNPDEGGPSPPPSSINAGGCIHQ
jgi:hypothetical protein